MPISPKYFPTTECHFSEWVIEDKNRNQLIEIIAYLYLRQEENAQRVINALEPHRRALRGRVVQNVVKKLTAPREEDLKLSRSKNKEQRDSAKKRIDTSIVHRDGLLFQHISWVAAHLALPNGRMTSPHVRPADKGFDGFIIELDKKGTAIKRIVLCEDKASKSPRRLITSSVWPEFSDILAGERDDEILADLVTLLKSIHNIDAETAVDKMFWESAREFRVAMATSEDQRKAGEFLHIIAGFEEVVGGNLGSRTAGVLPFQDVRQGLDIFAKEVINKVEEIAGV